jgi:hypothetical protein
MVDIELYREEHDINFGVLKKTFRNMVVDVDMDNLIYLQYL